MGGGGGGVFGGMDSGGRRGGRSGGTPSSEQAERILSPYPVSEAVTESREEPILRCGRERT